MPSKLPFSAFKTYYFLPILKLLPFTIWKTYRFPRYLLSKQKVTGQTDEDSAQGSKVREVHTPRPVYVEL